MTNRFLSVTLTSGTIGARRILHYRRMYFSHGHHFLFRLYFTSYPCRKSYPYVACQLRHYLATVHFSRTYHNIRPFLYARLKNGRIMLWQCPSVRPSFQDFSPTCFEISIWNLVYAFSRWHMSSLSLFTIGSLWPSLQHRVGQTQFLQIVALYIKVSSSNLVRRWPAVYFST